MKITPRIVTGTNEIACSTKAAPTARSGGAAKNVATANSYAAWKPPIAPGVGTATPTTSTAITRNEAG